MTAGAGPGRQDTTSTVERGIRGWLRLVCTFLLFGLWLAACAAWQARVAMWPSSVPGTSEVKAAMPARVGGRIPRAAREGWVVADIFGRVVSIQPGSGYLFAPLSNKYGSSRRLTVSWSGPDSAWPRSRRFPSQDWRIHKNAFLTRVPTVPGELDVRGRGQPPPNWYLVARGDIPSLDVWWPRASPFVGWDNADTVRLHGRRAVERRLAERLAWDGAAPWLARDQAQGAIKSLSKLNDEFIFAMGTGRAPLSEGAGAVTRLAAHLVVKYAWVRPGHGASTLLHVGANFLYVYVRRYGGPGAAGHSYREWRWICFNASGQCFARGVDIFPQQVPAALAIRRVEASAGLLNPKGNQTVTEGPALSAPPSNQHAATMGVPHRRGKE